MIGVSCENARPASPIRADRSSDRSAFERGLLLLDCGKSTFRLAPPLIPHEYDVDTGLAIFDECLKDG